MRSLLPERTRDGRLKTVFQLRFCLLFKLLVVLMGSPMNGEGRLDSGV